MLATSCAGIASGDGQKRLPPSRKANGMAVARRANERRDVTRIIFRSPDAVAWNLQGRKPNPFAPRCAAVIEIETRVVHQDRKPAANQDRHKKKIEEVAVAYPCGKTVRPSEIVGIYLGNSRNSRHSRYCDLDPGRCNQRRQPTCSCVQSPAAWLGPDLGFIRSSEGIRLVERGFEALEVGTKQRHAAALDRRRFP